MNLLLNRNYFVFLNFLFQVNVLTHTAEVKLTPRIIHTIERLKQLHKARDQMETFGVSQSVDENFPGTSCGAPANDKQSGDKCDNSYFLRGSELEDATEAVANQGSWGGGGEGGKW